MLQTADVSFPLNVLPPTQLPRVQTTCFSRLQLLDRSTHQRGKVRSNPPSFIAEASVITFAISEPATPNISAHLLSVGGQAFQVFFFPSLRFIEMSGIGYRNYLVLAKNGIISRAPPAPKALFTVEHFQISNNLHFQKVLIIFYQGLPSQLVCQPTQTTFSDKILSTFSDHPLFFLDNATCPKANIYR